jgi:hypothetical protein
MFSLNMARYLSRCPPERLSQLEREWLAANPLAPLEAELKKAEEAIKNR